MPIPHKYKMGETVFLNNNFEGVPEMEDETFIVITSYMDIMKYRNINLNSITYRFYDESTSERIQYALHSTKNNYIIWAFEKSIDPYCSNTERGKSFLKNIITPVYMNRYWGFNYDESKRFLMDYHFIDDGVKA